MKPFRTLARARTGDGAELTLHAREPHLFMRVNGEPLMATNAPESERALADLACKNLGGQTAARVLIGGLGFGFTLRRALELVDPAATIHVAELLPEVIAWNREFLAATNGPALDDPRVKILSGDVFPVLTGAPAASYDAVLLDVDNGPTALVQAGNSRLYATRGLAAIHRTLKPGGRLAIWSATRENAFAKKLTQAGFAVELVPARATPNAKRCAHTIIVASPV